MKKYYVQNGKIIINKYCVKYTYTVNNPNSEITSGVIQYASDENEFKALLAKLNRKGIEFEIIDTDTDSILKFNGMAVKSLEEARRLIEPTLEEVEADKIKEISDICQKTIYNGVDVTLTDGEVKHFSLKAEDQMNINSLISQVSLGNIKAESGVPYHSDGELCRLFSIADFTLIANTAMAFILQQTTYCNHLTAYVKSLETIEDVNAVEYTQELNGKFLESYNLIISNSKGDGTDEQKNI